MIARPVCRKPDLPAQAHSFSTFVFNRASPASKSGPINRSMKRPNQRASGLRPGSPPETHVTFTPLSAGDSVIEPFEVMAISGKDEAYAIDLFGTMPVRVIFSVPFRLADPVRPGANSRGGFAVGHDHAWVALKPDAPGLPLAEIANFVQHLFRRCLDDRGALHAIRAGKELRDDREESGEREQKDEMRFNHFMSGRLSPRSRVEKNIGTSRALRPA